MRRKLVHVSAYDVQLFANENDSFKQLIERSSPCFGSACSAEICRVKHIKVNGEIHVLVLKTTHNIGETSERNSAYVGLVHFGVLCRKPELVPVAASVA